MKKKSSAQMATPSKDATLKVKLDGHPVKSVPRAAYVKAKHKQMVEFGYANLTEAEVDAQVDAVLAGLKFGKGLTVIGKFMEGEVVK
jgi:hypothetical protein